MSYDVIYKNNHNVWGLKPNELILRIYNDIPVPANFLDLGCGQGRDTIFMLREGFNVDAVDISKEGIAAFEDKISEFGEKIKVFQENILDFEIVKNRYSIINAWNVLQFIPRSKVFQLIDRIKLGVFAGGFVVIAAFLEQDPLSAGVDDNKNCFFHHKELEEYFNDFKIASYEEQKLLDSGHPGAPNPHEHHIVRLIAKKII